MMYQVTFTFGLGPDPEVHRHPLEWVHARISRLFGGMTAVRGRGGWINPESGQLEYEHAETVTSYVEDSESIVRAQADQIAWMISRELKQDCVMVSIQPAYDVRFVTPDKRTPKVPL